MLHLICAIGRGLERFNRHDDDYARRGFDVHECDNCRTWVIRRQYTRPKTIGCGSYGIVCSAYDTERKEQVVLKKLYRAFRTKIDARRTYRELMLLKHMKHPNVVSLVDAFSPDSSKGQLTDIYFVTHWMPYSLEIFLEEQPRLSLDLVHKVTYQILRGLKYIHSAGIIHRDLKPNNVIINEDYEIKIIDFGLAREATQDSKLTGYVTSRFYRAPEIMFNWENYGNSGKLDVWSVGCIMAQMLRGEALFPGETEINQIALIIDLLGTPSDDLLDTIDESARNYVLTEFNKVEGKDFRVFFKAIQNDPDALDILSRMLKLDLRERCSASEALRHPFFSKVYKCEEQERVVPFTDPLEGTDASIEDFKDIVYAQLEDINASHAIERHGWMQ
ncbi:mitogen-activated protein kinase 11-like [Oscarella lobularis]|uniref:mitogen-activated protein kinase 11-like n=1 Tax=Oscarella lobularis TaxID=121494 RepID=UPI0033136DB8